MNDNIISPDDAAGLLDKLLSEQLPIRALFLSSTGFRCRINGRVDSVTPESGLVISVARPPSTGNAFLSVSLNRDCEFRFGDTRDLPEDERDEMGEKYGDTILAIRFLDTEDFLFMTFTTLSP
jgi:hypothetical protein